jgi:hypothetical protein
MMAQRDVSKIQPDVSPGVLVRPIKVLAVMGPIFFALAWMAIGFYAFFQIHAWGVKYDRKMAMIERGEVKPDTLCVTNVSEDKDHDGWFVAIGKGGKAVAWRSVNKVDDIQVGGTVAAYRFDDAYLIPQFDRGGFRWGKWVFLAVGLLPIPVIGGILLFKTLRGR